MADSCDAFYVGQEILDHGGLNGAPIWVLTIQNGKVTVGYSAIGGVPVAVTFDCDQFNTGFYALLDLLGIPHP